MAGPYSRLVLLSLVLGAVTCGGLACGSGGGSVASSRATADVTGRRVAAVSDGSVTVHNAGDRAVVSLPSHQVTIDRDRVLLDGEELAALPGRAAHVEVNATRGRLTITADGVPVASRPLSK